MGVSIEKKEAWVVCFFMRAPRIFLRLWENIFNKSSEPREAREDLGIFGFHVWFFHFAHFILMVRSLGGKIAVSTAQVLRAAVSGSWRALGFVGVGCQEGCFFSKISSGDFVDGCDFHSRVCRKNTKQIQNVKRWIVQTTCFLGDKCYQVPSPSKNWTQQNHWSLMRMPGAGR